MFKLQRKVRVGWSKDFAYAIGLITSDGCLSKDQRHFYFASADLELINNLKQALSLSNKLIKNIRGQKPRKEYFAISFGDKVFYKFLNKIGLTSKKSRTIKSVKVPPGYFPDFLRGLFDGDGTFYTFWDRRWPNSFGYQISFASASSNFIKWLKNILSKNYGVKGFIRKGDGVFNLRYVKGDSRKLFSAMYSNNKILFLKRKYTKMTNAFEQDKKLSLLRKMPD